MKAIGLLFTFLFVTRVVAGEPAAAAHPSARERLKSAIERAISHNPELRSMESRIRAARARVPQATALPDPELEAGIKDIPPSDFSLARSDFTMEMLTARQRFPGMGKRVAMRRSAEQAFHSVEAEHRGRVVAIAADVSESFDRLADLDRRFEILRETRTLLSDLVVAARERYRVGKGSQADVLRASVEKTALEDRLAQLSADRRTEAARFNALQDLPSDSDVPPVAWIGADATEPSEQDLMLRALSESPAVSEARARIAQAEQELGLAKLERRPDVTGMAYYGHRVKFEDLVGASVSINLPWAHPKRLEAARAEKEALLQGARADLSAVENEIRRAIAESSAALARSREQARLYRESIIPEAEVNARAAREAYGVGGVDFLTMIRAVTDLEGYRADQSEREAGIGIALSALQRASGLPLIPGTPQKEEIHAKE
jgi:outer membrane protein TolC